MTNVDISNSEKNGSKQGESVHLNEFVLGLKLKLVWVNSRKDHVL